jgi:hypothetical protein
MLVLPARLIRGYDYKSLYFATGKISAALLDSIRRHPYRATLQQRARRPPFSLNCHLQDLVD